MDGWESHHFSKRAVATHAGLTPSETAIIAGVIGTVMTLPTPRRSENPQRLLPSLFYPVLTFFQALFAPSPLLRPPALLPPFGRAKSKALLLRCRCTVNRHRRYGADFAGV